LAGFKSVYTPETSVIHLGGGLSLGISEEREIRIFRNKLLTYLKNYETKNLFLRFPSILLLSLAKKVLAILKNRKVPFCAFKGFIEFLKATRPIVERERIQMMRVLSDSQIFSRCNIPEKQSFWDTLMLM